MWKLRGAVLAASSVCALVPAGAAMAATGGDSNAGDVWVDSVTATSPGPGHEMDPHLPCADINLYGSGLADSSGTFTIDGWPPSGKKAQDYSGNWNYSQDPTRKSGTQVIATISVTQLIDAAAANGEAPVNKNGYHFKLALTQDPQKYKTFWVACSPPTPSSPGGSTQSGGGTQTGSTTTTSSTTSTSTSTPTASTLSSSSVKSTTTHRSGRHHRHHARRHHRAASRRHLMHVRRHHRARHRHIASVKSTTAAFTG